MKKSLLLLAGSLSLAQFAQAGAPITLRPGETRRIMLNDGRSVLFSCTRAGGRQTATQIPLAPGQSIQITQYRDPSPTLVYCSNLLPPPIPGYGTEVVIFSNSDSCSGSVAGVATLLPGQDVADQCRAQLPNAGASAWSVRANGQCVNIADTNVLSACAQAIVPQNADDVQMTIFSNSDSCSGNVSGSGILRRHRSQAEQCQEIAARGNGSAWSIRIGNTCTNIADTNVLSACLGTNLPNQRPNRATDVVIYSNSDSCSGSVSGAVSLIPDYDLQDQCSNLIRTGSNSAWSVKADGACLNIADTDVVSACLNVRVPSYRGARQVVIYSNSDSCSGSVSAAGYIDTRYSAAAQCQALKQNGGSSRAWSVRIDDRCVNVPDTDYVSACIGAVY